MHGLDLVVRKFVYGKDAGAFDIAMFFALCSEKSSSALQNRADEENLGSIHSYESDSEDEEKIVEVVRSESLLTIEQP